VKILNTSGELCFVSTDSNLLNVVAVDLFPLVNIILLFVLRITTNL